MYTAFKREILLLLTPILIIASCSSKSNDGGNNNLVFNNKDSLIANKKIMTNQQDFEDITTLTLEQALQKYGQPLEREKFLLDGGLSEFRIELYNIYPKEVYLKDSIYIEELTWSKDTANNITAWYQQVDKEWIPKNTLTWSKGSEF